VAFARFSLNSTCSKVGQELALRNETLRRDVIAENERYKTLLSSFEEMHSLFLEQWAETGTVKQLLA
jgi:hypothetical protein